MNEVYTFKNLNNPKKYSIFVPIIKQQFIVNFLRAEEEKLTSHEKVKGV